LINTLITSALEKSLNGYLHLDPESLKNIQALDGKVACVELKDWNCKLYLRFSQDKIVLMNYYEGEVDCSISGSPFALLRMSHGQENYIKDIDVKGDMELAQSVRALLRDVDIDWEEYLSKATGDVIAHKIGDVFRGTINFAKQSKNNFNHNVSEYLHEEIRALPSREEISDFFNDVDLLRNNIERVEAKINLLRESK